MPALRYAVVVSPDKGWACCCSMKSDALKLAQAMNGRVLDLYEGVFLG